ncbi:DUF4352 domain-containing protein [Bacillus inaquosorum]|uniref:DUF4352 domain-containing protein n=1 Tax=Bacillus inaquosorum TaxID=483913 RepID=UPI0022803C22|nr:DUF4352 domain-containing protein [Bacillus inaquosorum]MCY7900338.1 DUF4352 domain-containing protein [Bacillus inaquosorum]MCY8237297.1 DUF4352 domain-containing protein [Bacillus inaquosorum]MCY8260860.1 DUF4352 domain-containing protein [Bacillus inaquosorum]MCY8285948.1 DUF4352 domain-containing protein [Bacillus inaquosorum]MCY9456569.1 DUF4352 domain-containing protein [Bacillus inaquosorum]
MKKVLLLLFVLTIGFALSACSQSSDASEKEKPKEKTQEELETELDKELKKGGEPKIKKDDQIHKIGETIKVNDINFTVNKVDREQNGQYGDLGGKESDKIKTVKGDEERLIIEVTLEYVGKGSMEYSRLGLDLKDRKNKSVRSVISLEDKGKMFLGGNLASGKKVTGVVSYVIPKGEQKNYTLVYNPFLTDTRSDRIEESAKYNIDYLIKLDK